MGIMGKLLDFLRLDKPENDNFEIYDYDIPIIVTAFTPPPDPVDNTPPSFIPSSVDEFEQCHYTALRRLNKCRIDETFSGLLSITVDMPRFITKAQELGLVEIANYEYCLSLLRVKELQDILSEYSLTKSGKKDILIDRILISLSEFDIRNAKSYIDFYILTPYGKKVIDDSYEKEHLKNLTIFKARMNAILAETFHDPFAEDESHLIAAAEIYSIRYGAPRHTIKSYLKDAYDVSDYALSRYDIYIKLKKYEVSLEEFTSKKKEIPFNASINDIIWGILNERTVSYTYSKSYNNLRKNYENIAMLLEEEDSFDRALEFYIASSFLELNGYDADFDYFGIPGTSDFHLQRKIFYLRSYYSDATAQAVYNNHSRMLPYTQITKADFLNILNCAIADKYYRYVPNESH